MLQNKLGITSSSELSNDEEKITKQRALRLYDSGDINKVQDLD